MRNALVCGASLVSVAFATSIAAANGPPAPAWCKVNGQIQQGFADAIKKDDDVQRAAIAIAYQVCNPQYAEDEDRATIDAGYKRWTARLELTDAEWGEIAQWATGRGSLDIVPIDAKAKWSSLAPIDQYAFIQRPVVEVPGLVGETDFHYVADAFGSHLSELGRLSYIDRCLQFQSKPVVMAMCEPDIEAFDFHKIVGELRADKSHSPEVRAIIRLVADRDRSLIAARKDAIAKLVAKDEAYKKMFEIAAAQRKDWDARWRDSADLLAVQDLMDDAMVSNSRKATQGCHEKTWNALKAVVVKLPAKAFATKRIPDREYQFVDDVINRIVETIIADPNGFLAASAYTQCESLDPADGKRADNLSTMLSNNLSRWAGYRGPRSATFTAIVLANLQLDDRSEHIEFPDLQRFWFKNGNGQGGGNDGSVESVKTDGDSATVTFGQKMVKETVDTGCSRSNHVVGIRDNGSIEYEYNCTGSKTVSYDHRPKPAKVKARYATGLKAGNTVALNTDIVWMAWPKPGAAVPSFVLGQPVK